MPKLTPAPTIKGNSLSNLLHSLSFSTGVSIPVPLPVVTIASHLDFPSAKSISKGFPVGEIYLKPTPPRTAILGYSFLN